MATEKRKYTVFYGKNQSGTIWATSPEEARAFWVSAFRPEPTRVEPALRIVAPR